MKGISGALFYLRIAVEKPGNAWQVLCAFPKLLVHCVLLRKPVLLLCRYSGIGDIVCTFPSVAILKEQHPGSLIVYETRRSYLTLVRSCRPVDLVVEEASLLSMLLQRFFKPKETFRPFLPDELRPPQPRQRIHLTEEFRKSLGLKSESARPVRFDISARALRRVRQRLKHERLRGKPLVIIHTGPTWKVKEWPEKNWRLLVAELKKQNQIEVIQIGEDRTPYGETRESPRVTGSRNWVGTLTVDQTLALLSLAVLFVGIDSGVMHLAGAVNAPCVGLFGPTDPACFLPKNGRAAGVTADVPCLGCHHDPEGPRHWQNGCSENIRCMSELGADEVLLACNQLLDHGHKPS
jgi:ADP-heptose:LPS heptosyltransferase